MTIEATPADRAAIKSALLRSARLLAPPAEEDATRQLARHRLRHELDAAVRLAVLAGEDSVALLLVDAEISLGQSLPAPSHVAPEPDTKSRRAWKSNAPAGARARKRARKRGATFIPA